MPEIRSLTVPLIEKLNIEVETLDTLEGIDTASLPEGFAEQAATYRLASSIAVVPPPVNLLPIEITADRTSRHAQRIVAVGAAAAVVLAAFLYSRARTARQEAERQVSVVRSEISRVQPPGAPPASFDAQGPAMARTLEALAAAVPAGVIVRSVRALPEGVHWNITIEAVAAGDSEARANANADAFLRALDASPVFGKPLLLPVRQPVGTGSALTLVATYRVPR